MTTTTKDNEKDVPAVPLQIDLRDYFAGQALVGLLSNEQMTAIHTVEEMGSVAFVAADAMIAARKAGG